MVCTLPVILLRAGLHPRFDIARNVLSFGLPNVASLVAIWVLQLSDRYLLAHLSSLAQTASYSVAYNLGGSIGCCCPLTIPTGLADGYVYHRQKS